MTGQPKRILVLSDMHVGSLWGMWPLDFKSRDTRTGEDLHFNINHTQFLLWEHWMRLLSYLKKNPVECILFNGDICDGDQWQTRCKGLVTANLKTQADAAIDIISTLPKVKKYFTVGTRYHSIEDRPLEEYIAEKVGGMFGDDLIINTSGLRIHMAHAIPNSGSSWQYWTTALARDLLLYSLHDSEEKYGKIDVVLRSHRHNFCEVSFGSQMGIVTPCWQTRTVYAVQKDLVSPPDIGWIVLEVHGPKRILVDRSGIKHIGKPSQEVGK